MKKQLLSLLLVAVLALSIITVHAEEPTRIFTDSCGREVTVPAEITRIAPSSSLAQIILYAIAPEQMVSLSGHWDDRAQDMILDEVYNLPVLGRLTGSADLNVEELAFADPQIIIDIGEPKDSISDDLETLQTQTQIPAVFISSSLETLPETFRTLGSLLGKEAEAEELAMFCEAIYTQTEDIMSEVDQKANLLYVLGEEGLNVLAKDSYHAEIIDMLANNLAAVEKPVSKGLGNEVSMEQISLWNPDFVVFAAESIYSTVKEIPAWNQVQAIVDDQYVEVPDLPHNWLGMPPSCQRYLALIWLPSVLYPEHCTYDVQEEVTEFYELFYHCTLTDEQYAMITANAFLK